MKTTDGDTFKGLVDAVEGSLSRAELLSGGRRLLAAVSGGADSVALLMALCELRKAYDIEIIACHVQHGLRGDASLGDEAYVRGLCDRLGVKCDVRRAKLAGGMDDAGAETRARNERMRLFDIAMRENSADALLLAHHMNDQAETALMRLLRGAGAAGLCAMPPANAFSCGVALRPFIGISKRDITEALQTLGVTWREDESNAAPCTPRNALRINALPLLEALYPEAQRHIANTAEALRTDEQCLGELTDRLYDRAALECAGILALHIPTLMEAPDALRRRALRRLYLRGVALAGLSPDERALGYCDTMRLMALVDAQTGETHAERANTVRPYNDAPAGDMHNDAQTGDMHAERANTVRPYNDAPAGKTLNDAQTGETHAERANTVRPYNDAPAGDTLNLPNDLRALRGTEYLHITRQGGAAIVPPPTDELTVSADVTRYELAGAVIRLEGADGSAASSRHEKPPRDANTVWLPLALLAMSPVLRTPREGDVLRPFGANGSKPLRRWMTDRKLDAPFRAAIPVMAIGSRVLWLPGLCTAEELRAGEGGHVTLYIEGGSPRTDKPNNTKE